MRQNEMRAQLAHDDVIVDDHVAARGMLGKPGGDLLSPVGAERADRGLVDDAAGEPPPSRISCSAAMVLPYRQVDETTTSAPPRVTISFNT